MLKIRVARKKGPHHMTTTHRAVAPVKVVGLVAVVVAAEAAHPLAELGRDRELEEAYPVPQQSDACNEKRLTN